MWEWLDVGNQKGSWEEEAVKVLKIGRREGSKHMQWENGKEKLGLPGEMGEMKECRAYVGAEGKTKFKANSVRSLHMNAHSSLVQEYPNLKQSGALQ